MHLGRWTVDLAGRTVTDADGARVHLTPTEWQLLDVLLPQPRRAWSASASCCSRCGARPTSSETHYLRQYMKNLRRKLEDDPTRPQHLLTEPGMGYRFQP